MPIYSYSKIDTFEKCPLKFKFRYIDKIKPETEKNIEMHLGEVIHSTLEWLYVQILENKFPTIEEVIIYYSRKWQDEYKEDLQIVKKDITPEDYFNKGIQFLVDYYTRHKPFKDNTLELEKEIKFKLDKDGKYKLRGFIDRLAYNQETKEYEIHDYKTSNNFPNNGKLNNDKQLALYSIAIKELFGNDKNICLVWHYLAYDQKICIRKTNDEIEKLKKEVLEIIKKIEETKEFIPNKSILCNWCEYKSLCNQKNNAPPQL